MNASYPVHVSPVIFIYVFAKFHLVRKQNVTIAASRGLLARHHVSQDNRETAPAGGAIHHDLKKKESLASSVIVQDSVLKFDLYMKIRHSYRFVYWLAV